MCSRPLCQTLLKALQISRAMVRMAPHKFKELSMLPVTTVTRPANDLDNLSHIENQKRVQLVVPKQFIIDELFKDLKN